MPKYPHLYFNLCTGAASLYGSWSTPWSLNIKMFWMESLAPRPTPILENRLCIFRWRQFKLCLFHFCHKPCGECSDHIEYIEKLRSQWHREHRYSATDISFRVLVTSGASRVFRVHDIRYENVSFPWRWPSFVPLIRIYIGLVIDKLSLQRISSECFGFPHYFHSTNTPYTLVILSWTLYSLSADSVIK
jgi:hypothetical protein